MNVSWKTLVLEAWLVTVLVKVSWKTLVLEAWIVTFGESLVENARFGSLAPECVAKGSRLTWESEGRAVFAGRCFPVRNRPQPSSTVLNCSNPSPMAPPLGRARKSDF